MSIATSASSTLGWALSAALIAGCSPSRDFVGTLFPNDGKVLDPGFAVVRPWSDVTGVLYARLDTLRAQDGTLGSFQVDGVQVEIASAGPRVNAVTFVMASHETTSAHDQLVARWGSPDVARDPEGRAVWTGPDVGAAFGARGNSRPLTMASTPGTTSRRG